MMNEDSMYGTRRLDSEPEEPEDNEETQPEVSQEDAGTIVTPPPLPEAEQAQTPPPLPDEEDESPPPLPPAEVITPPPVPEAETPAAAPDSGTVVITPSASYEASPAEPEDEMPSPFDEGAPVITGSSEPVTPPVTPPPVTPPVTPRPASPPPAVPPTPADAASAPAKKNNTVWIIVIVVAVLLVLCCCLVAIVALVVNWTGITGNYNSLPLGAVSVLQALPL